ncbi:hypothetical protein ScPMuIL_014743 [Solemya velum]
MSAQPKRPRSRTRITKDNGDPEKAESPKPLLRQASSAKLPVSKLKKDELVRLNNDLQKQVNAITIQNQQMREKLTALANIISESARIKGLEPIVAVKESVDIPTDRLVGWLGAMLQEGEKSVENPVESRVEELETRTTYLTTEVAKLVQLLLRVENGLEGIENTERLEDAHQKARLLLYETKGSRLFNGLANKSPPDNCDEDNSESGQNTERKTLTVIQDMQNPAILDLTPPLKKLPGNTHVHDTHTVLKQYLVQELSKYKGNGADWRLLGERVGIPSDTIQQWRRWKVELPMQYVLETWGRSPGATIRLLHRHLASPQLRYTILAKIISDFYSID